MAAYLSKQIGLEFPNDQSELVGRLQAVARLGWIADVVRLERPRGFGRVAHAQHLDVLGSELLNESDVAKTSMSADR